jgi:hypothetical protein
LSLSCLITAAGTVTPTLRHFEHTILIIFTIIGLLYFAAHAYFLVYNLTHVPDIKFRHWHETLYRRIVYENTLGPSIYLMFVFPSIAIVAMGIMVKLYT